ncbi:MAG: GAF domain-containing protein [Bacteroidetes bacterium]|nr:GAF domain-containing protein [Bacteroidota bacterium]
MGKLKRYERVYDQLQQLLLKSDDKEARMCTITALLHHKMDHFFWTGFYCLQNEKLIVRTYQGSIACMELQKDIGVCWASINSNKTIVVQDVEQFSGHISCDSRSKSEIVVPLHDKIGKIIGVLDVDSKELNSFDQLDAFWLEKIVSLI